VKADFTAKISKAVVPNLLRLATSTEKDDQSSAPSGENIAIC